MRKGLRREGSRLKATTTERGLGQWIEIEVSKLSPETRTRIIGMSRDGVFNGEIAATIIPDVPMGAMVVARVIEINGGTTTAREQQYNRRIRG